MPPPPRARRHRVGHPRGPDDGEHARLAGPGASHHAVCEHEVCAAVTACRCAGGTTWGSAVPGPMTHVSAAGSRRTVGMTVVEVRASTSSAEMRRSSPSTSTVTRRSDKSSSQPRSALRLALNPAPSSNEPRRRPLDRRCGHTPRRPCGPHRRRSAARPARDSVQALDGRLIVAGRPEAQVALPHQRLQQGVGVAAQTRCGVTEPPSATDRPTQLLARQGPLEHGLPDGLAECRPVGRRQSVGLLPAGQLPLAAGRTEGR